MFVPSGSEKRDFDWLAQHMPDYGPEEQLSLLDAYTRLYPTRVKDLVMQRTWILSRIQHRNLGVRERAMMLGIDFEDLHEELVLAT